MKLHQFIDSIIIIIVSSIHLTYFKFGLQNLMKHLTYF